MKDIKISYFSGSIKDVTVLKPAVVAGSNRLNKKDWIVRLHDEEFESTPRFWASIFSRYLINRSIFRYFNHQEVFERIVSTRDDVLRFTSEKGETGKPRLLAIALNKDDQDATIRHDQLVNLMEDNGGSNLNYHNGVVSGKFSPVAGNYTYQIGGEDFRNSIRLEVPIDGYGKPQVYLELIRQICSNGAVGYGKAFRSEINTGREPYYALERTLETYDNDQGFAALQSRFDAAQKSWASVKETQKLHRVLCSTKNGLGHLKDFHKLTGDLPTLYGLTNLDVLPPKRQAVLPSKAKVYDLINFASEIATHKVEGNEEKRYQAFIGSLVSETYDLENSAEKVTEFKDFVTEGGKAAKKSKVSA